ncbi:MAG: hypothetical protein ACOY46_16205 [Bacillota bacterium]
MRRNCYPDYRYLEGILQWYFGQEVSLNYRYEPEDKKSSYPLVVVNGETIAVGKIPAEEVISFVERLGVKRLDDDL